MNITLAHLAPSLFSVPSWLQAAATDQSRQARARVPQPCSETTFTRNQIREVKNPLGVTMECLSGQVWITLDGDPRDVVLDAGQVFTVDRDQRTLVMALDEAHVRYIRPASA